MHFLKGGTIPLIHYAVHLDIIETSDDCVLSTCDCFVRACIFELQADVFD